MRYDLDITPPTLTLTSGGHLFLQIMTVPIHLIQYMHQLRYNVLTSQPTHIR